MKKTIAIYLSIFSMAFIGCDAQSKPNDIAIKDEVKSYSLETVASDIQIPWGMTWLPDGSMLVTEKSGILYQVKNGAKKKKKSIFFISCITS